MKRNAYRIKVKIFKNSRREYVPQVKILFFWMNLDYLGDKCLLPCISVRTETEARKAILLHKKGNIVIERDIINV